MNPKNKLPPREYAFRAKTILMNILNIFRFHHHYPIIHQQRRSQCYLLRIDSNANEIIFSRNHYI